MKPYLEKAIDEIDACVFTGGDFYDDEDRTLFLGFIERWKKAVLKIGEYKTSLAAGEAEESGFLASVFKTDVPNRNGVVIPKEVLKEALKKFFSDGKPKYAFYHGNRSEPAASVKSFSETEDGVKFTFSIEPTPAGGALRSAVMRPEIRPRALVSEIIGNNITKIDEIVSLRVEDGIVLL